MTVKDRTLVDQRVRHPAEIKGVENPHATTACVAPSKPVKSWARPDRFAAEPRPYSTADECGWETLPIARACGRMRIPDSFLRRRHEAANCCVRFAGLLAGILVGAISNGAERPLSAANCDQGGEIN